MSGRVEGKVALITGAARGLGRAHALRLAEEGANIIAVDICAPVAGVAYDAATEDDLAETVRLVENAGRSAVSAVVDVRAQAALRAAVDDGVAQLGKLDVVVANAGIVIHKPWDQVTEENFRNTVEVNLFGTWNTVMVAAPHLIGNGGGSIILVSSVAGLKALPFMIPYTASKHAVVGLARGFAAELAKHQIRVNTLHPGGARTEMASDHTKAAVVTAIESNPGLAGMLTNLLPVDMTEPHDQANAVLFLASDESRYVTSTTMTVDAGISQF